MAYQSARTGRAKPGIKKANGLKERKGHKGMFTHQGTRARFAGSRRLKQREQKRKEAAKGLLRKPDAKARSAGTRR